MLFLFFLSLFAQEYYWIDRFFIISENQNFASYCEFKRFLPKVKNFNRENYCVVFINNKKPIGIIEKFFSQLHPLFVSTQKSQKVRWGDERKDEVFVVDVQDYSLIIKNKSILTLFSHPTKEKDEFFHRILELDISIDKEVFSGYAIYEKANLPVSHDYFTKAKVYEFYLKSQENIYFINYSQNPFKNFTLSYSLLDKSKIQSTKDFDFVRVSGKKIKISFPLKKIEIELNFLKGKKIKKRFFKYDRYFLIEGYEYDNQKRNKLYGIGKISCGF